LKRGKEGERGGGKRVRKSEGFGVWRERRGIMEMKGERECVRREVGGGGGGGLPLAMNLCNRICFVCEGKFEDKASTTSIKLVLLFCLRKVTYKSSNYVRGFHLLFHYVLTSNFLQF
jgi:hypothetical protein